MRIVGLNVGLRSLILIVLLLIGIVPLVLMISVNLPKVAAQLEDNAEKQMVLQLKDRYYRASQLSERRKESVRILSMLTGLRELVTPSDTHEISTAFVKSHMPELIRNWFNAQKDIVSIVLYDRFGEEIVRLGRDEKFNIVLQEPRNQSIAGQMAFEKGREQIVGESYVYVAAINFGFAFEKDGLALFHHPEVRLGVPVFDRHGEFGGVLILKSDITFLVPDVTKDLLVRGDGAYIPLGHSHDKSISQITGDAFQDFPGLKDVIDRGTPAIIEDREGRKIAWVPLILDKHSESSLWTGSPVDLTAIDNWRKSFLIRVAVVSAVLVVFTSLVAVWLADKADDLRKKLLDGLSGLLEHGRPMRFSWSWPRELKKTASDLNRLSSMYLEAEEARKEAEKALKALNRQQKLILDSAAEGIIGTDKDGKIIFANRAAADLFGFELDEMEGRDLHSLIHFMRTDRGQYPREECPFCIGLRTGELHFQREEVFWKRDGSATYVHYVSSPLLDVDDTIQGTVMCIRDITSQKEAEEKMAQLRIQLVQSQKLEAIGTLAGGVAHDFNNLLTAITGYTDLILLDLEPRSAIYHQVKAIQDAARSAAELTSQLLAFSRKQKISPKVVDVNHLVANLKKMLSRLIGENISLETRFDDEHLLVMADQGMIEQVIMNLVINARDAMPDGGSLLIKTEEKSITADKEGLYLEDRIGSFVCISVKDTGCGMDEEILARIFEPFFTTKGMGRGTGLGLAVVHGIVEQHGGWIDVNSEPGKGTEFHVYLPKYTDAGLEDAKVEESADVPWGHGRRVLILEDESEVRKVAEAILVTGGYEVRSASCIKDAFDLLNKEGSSIDLIVSDVVLPDGNGLDFVKEVRVRMPDMPVLVMSGYAYDSSGKAIVPGRGVHYLQKPFRRSELLRAAADALGNRTADYPR